MKLELDGIFPPHITPFSKNEEIDDSSLRTLVHFWLDSGCAGLVSCASNGEGPYMTREERRKVLRLVIDEVNGNAAVVAGVGAPSTRETRCLMRDAEDEGADGLLIVSPYYYKPNPREVFEHYSNLIKSTSVPVILYNVPKFTGYNVDPALIVQLAQEHDQLVGIKDSSGSIAQISELAHRLTGRVSVLAGTADVILPCLLMGGTGAIVAIANVAPRLCVDLYNEFKAHNFETARELQIRLLQLNDILVRKFNQISAIKDAMNQLGMTAGYPRGPSLPLDDAAKKEITEVLTKSSLLS